MTILVCSDSFLRHHVVRVLLVSYQIWTHQLLLLGGLPAFPRLHPEGAALSASMRILEQAQEQTLNGIIFLVYLAQHNVDDTKSMHLPYICRCSPKIS